MTVIMADVSIAKLVALGVDADIAALCVEAELRTPRQLKAAEAEDLPEGASSDAVIAAWRARQE